MSQKMYAAFILFSILFFSPGANSAENKLMLAPLTTKQFEKKIDIASQKLELPKWEFLEIGEVGNGLGIGYSITTNIKGIVLVPEKSAAIQEIMILLENRNDLGSYDVIRFLLSFSAVLSTIMPEMPREEQGEILRELGVKNALPKVKTKTTRRGITITFTPSLIENTSAFHFAPEAQ